MHEAAAPLQVGMNVVGTLGITGALFAAGNLLGRGVRQVRRSSRTLNTPRSTTISEAANSDSSVAVAEPAPIVRDNRTERRFEIHVDDDLVGVAEYERNDGVVTFNHTEVSPRHRGRGLSGALIKFALDASRIEGLSVESRCPHVLTFISKHGEYHELLASAMKPSEETEGCCALPS